MKFSKDQNTLTLDDGTKLTATPSSEFEGCFECAVMRKPRGETGVLCRRKHQCSPKNRTDRRDIIWKVKPKEPMETKKEQFNRILQRMKNRRYLGWVTAIEYPRATLVHDMNVTPGGGSKTRIGDDCWLHKLGPVETEVLHSYDRKTPPHVGANCLVTGPISIPEGSIFGPGSLFEGLVTFAKGVAFGDRCLFGPGCTFGSGCTFGKDCVFLCDDPTAKPVVLKEFFVGNLDRTKRKVEITIWSDYSIQVKAGCFAGPLDAFVERAENEGKLFYARGIPLIANIAADQLRKDRGDK